MQRKIALITGSARGIGYGIAQALARDNCHIVVNDIEQAPAVADALLALKELGAETLYCQADISDPAARAQMLDEIKARFGCLHVLVNNAGVAPKVRVDLLEASEASFERLMRINLQGPYFLTQEVARWMIEQARGGDAFEGCIVNISSISAEVASPSRGEYCVSKAGLSMATRLWAVRLGEFGIPVYEIRPGIIHTDMTETVQEKYDKLIENGLLVQPRWGEPHDIGRAVASLVRGDMAYSTGQVINVDGGLTQPRL